MKMFLKFPYDKNDRLDLNLLPPLDQIAAFFLETYQGWGACMYPQQYIDKINSLCKDNNILLCMDEVQAGFYRMGEFYGYMTYGSHIEPDLICVGKGLSSSLPISAVISRDEIIDVDASINLSSTHAGNALCCAAALANIRFLSSPQFKSELLAKSKVFVKKNNALERFDCVEKVNARGMVSGIIFKNIDAANYVVDKLIKNGILPVWTRRESIKLGPPLTIPIEDINKSMDKLFEILKHYDHP